MVETYNQYTHLPIPVLLAKPSQQTIFWEIYHCWRSWCGQGLWNWGEENLPCTRNQGPHRDSLWTAVAPSSTSAQPTGKCIPRYFRRLCYNRRRNGNCAHGPYLWSWRCPLPAAHLYRPLGKRRKRKWSSFGHLAGSSVQLPEIGEVCQKHLLSREGPEKSVGVAIAIRLKEENRAFKVEKYVTLQLLANR